MESILIQCTHTECKHKFKIADKYAGKKIRCPKCKLIILVPQEKENIFPAPSPIPALSIFTPVAPWISRITQGAPKIRTAIYWMFLISFSIHLAFAPFIPTSPSVSKEELERYKTEYQKKIEAAKVARVISKKIAKRITMPPPPPDPEMVVEKTLSTVLSRDLEKVVGNLLDVQITSRITERVIASLKDELAAAAKDIAEGKLSKEEIKALHEKFKKKAHDYAVKELKDYRIETQQERATLSTMEWYEKNVGKNLFRNLRYDLFHRKYGRHGWAPLYCRSLENMHWGRWGFLGWRGYGNIMNQLKNINKKLREKWPNAGIQQANFITNRLRQIHGKQKFDGRFKQWYSWQTAFEGYLQDFYPHKKKETLLKYTESLKILWQEAFGKSNEYLKQAESEKEPSALKTAQTACLKAVHRLTQSAQGFLVKGGRSYRIINQTVRSRVLRSKTQEVYQYWVNEWVRELDPMIREFVETQFDAGIIVHKEGIKKVMQEFTEQIIPLLRRDVKKMIPQFEFNRLVFRMDYAHSYRSKVTKIKGLPNKEDIQKDEAALAHVLKGRPELKEYVEGRKAVITQQFKDAIERVKESLLELVLTGNLMLRGMANFVEGVDYADKVQEKFDARAAAIKGRGQDLANLTAEGVPDTSAPLVALLFGGSKGYGASLTPILTGLYPGFFTQTRPASALRYFSPSFPKPPGKWGFEEQAEVKGSFKSPRLESIPFLANFPNLDGDLSDWGKIRPLILQARNDPILVYAAWNYQGFFFGYQVQLPIKQFYYSSQGGIKLDLQRQAGTMYKKKGISFAYKGDYFRLLFDTLDARDKARGEAHIQEFVILPLGTDTDPMLPGIERIISSKRDAKAKEYRGVKSTGKIFPQQPRGGPDGTGPYRITQQDKNGYTVEIFIPRTLLNFPIFAPGWYIGFDCAVATGYQGRGRLSGQYWASRDLRYASDKGGNHPDQWGDLLLLGTDARFLMQDADETGSISTGIIPGHSYLLSVIDPDRNVYLTKEDTVLVSAEVKLANNASRVGDVELYILKETQKNSGVFRGYVDTQPGKGHQVQGILEVMPGQMVRFGYVDFANAKGVRNVVTEIVMPVVSGMMTFNKK